MTSFLRLRCEYLWTLPHSAVWMEQQYDEETGETKHKSSAKVRRMFRRGFMPLPLALESIDGCCVSPTYPWLSVSNAVQCDPQLTAAAVRNGEASGSVNDRSSVSLSPSSLLLLSGMELEFHQVEVILENWCEYFATAKLKPFIKVCEDSLGFANMLLT